MVVQTGSFRYFQIILFGKILSGTSVQNGTGRNKFS